MDNIYIERFWKTIKYQHIYLNPANDRIELYAGIKKWLDRYHHRNHQGIDAKPVMVYATAAQISCVIQLNFVKKMAWLMGSRIDLSCKKHQETYYNCMNVDKFTV